MKIFIDSADIYEIEKFSEIGIIDGVTTNPSIIAKSGIDYISAIKKIANIVNGPISAEVISTNTEDMCKEGYKLSDIAENIVIKIPATFNGFKASKILSENDIKVNITLCFNMHQALMAAKTGAKYMSYFVGRQEDSGIDAIESLSEIVAMYRDYYLETEIISASIRNIAHVVGSMKCGVDVVTISPTIINKMMQNKMTDDGLDIFLNDWKNSGQRSII